MFKRTYALDLSKYQHPIDYSKFHRAAPPPSIVAHRATIGSLYQDPFFHSFCREGLASPQGKSAEPSSSPMPFFTAYHVVRPDYPPKDQVVNFLKTISGSPISFPVVLDCELSCSRNGKEVALNILAISRWLEDALAYPPILYSRANWLEHYFNLPEAATFYYWIASYPAIAGASAWEAYAKRPALPAYISADHLILHQITDRADGGYFGAASRQIDLSFWVHDQPPRSFLTVHYPSILSSEQPAYPPCLRSLWENCPLTVNKKDAIR